MVFGLSSRPRVAYQWARLRCNDASDGLIAKGHKNCVKILSSFQGGSMGVFLFCLIFHYKILCHVSIYCHPVLRDVQYFRFYVIYHVSLLFIH